MGVSQIAPQRWLGRFFATISLQSNTMRPEPETMPVPRNPCPGKSPPILASLGRKSPR